MCRVRGHIFTPLNRVYGRHLMRAAAAIVQAVAAVAAAGRAVLVVEARRARAAHRRVAVAQLVRACRARPCAKLRTATLVKPLRDARHPYIGTRPAKRTATLRVRLTPCTPWPCARAARPARDLPGNRAAGQVDLDAAHPGRP